MSKRARWVLVVGVLLVMAALSVVKVLPWYIEKRIVEDAQARGIDVKVGQLSVGWGKARAAKVTATFPDVPQVHVEIAELLVTLDGVNPRELDLSGLDVQLVGPAAEVSKAIDAFQRRPPSGSGGAGAGIVRVGVKDGKVHWVGVLGADTTLTVEAVSGNLHGADVEFDGERAQLALRDLSFGPYHLSWVRSAGTDTLTWKAPKDDARIEQVIAADGKRTSKVTIPPSSAQELGIPAAALGLVADEKSTLELHLEHTVAAGKVDGHLALAADRVYLGHSLSPTSVQLDLGYAGADGPGAVWAVRDGTLKAGPFSGNIRGTLEPVPLGVLAHLQYLSGLISCGDAVKSAASGALTPALGAAAAATTEALAQLFGMDKAVEGTIKLEGTLDADTRNPSAAKASFHTTGDCTLSFLPGK